jgi:hypothetical protein
MTDNAETGKPKRQSATEVIDKLVEMIKEMSPYLDMSGTAYCKLTADGGVIFTLRDRRVRSYLIYRYHELHAVHPGRERVNEAIEFVEGQLLATTSPRSPLENCPVLRCLLRALQEEESGAGSAMEILQMLREVKRKHKGLLEGEEDVPDNPTAMGKWLARNQLRLRAYGIDLSRPPRGSKKRLWDWQVIHASDGNDTCSPQVSRKHAGASHQENTDEDASADILTDESITKELGDSLDGTDS